MDKIKIIEYEEMDLSNSLLLVAFPTVGLISSIAGHHIIQTLKLKQIGSILSDKFVPTAVISNGFPSPPVRIYAGKKICEPSESCDQIAVIIAEFLPNQDLIKPLVDEILKWAKKKKCRYIIGLEGSHSTKKPEGENPKVYGVISRPTLKDVLDKYSIEQSNEGMITGVTGVLLFTAALQNQDVLCLLAEAHASFPDSRAAANIIEKLDKMLPGIKIDPKPLYEEAKEIEKRIRAYLEQSKPTAPTQMSIPTDMYR